jgi:hypothetical protein
VTEVGPYSTAAGVEAAIKDAAKKAATADPSLTTTERIRLEHFNRFLSRVFSEGNDSEWLLKGGTGMLARVPSARSTRDVDLFREELTLDRALADLRRLAAVDLVDHFAFIYTGHRESIGSEEQPYTQGYVVSFDIFIGGRKKATLHVDLSIGAMLTAPVTIVEPENALDLPRLRSHEYRLYPVVDQIADKVCATMQTYNGRPSSREKDLVDLVILAVTQKIDGNALRVAIEAETRRRLMDPFDSFVVPEDWGRRYAKMARSVPVCADYATVELARNLVARFVDTALTGDTNDKTWSHESLSWN